MPTQEQYNVSKSSKIITAKIYLLNFKFQRVEELSGVVLSGSTYSISATSDIRRSCNISLIPTDSSFDISVGNKIWLDKYVQIYVQEKNVNTNEIAETNLGIYMINNPSRVYSAENNTMTIQGIDLMAKMTGLRNGNLEGMAHIIPQNSNVRNVIISTINLAGFTKYVIEECPFSVPNDIKIDVGGTIYDILKQLLDIDARYEMYFDVDGIFHYDLIPNGYNEQVMVDDDIWNNTLIEYSINTDFENVKNIIEVFGKTHDIKNYSDATISESNYLLTIASVTTLYDNIKIGFTTPSNVISEQANIKINSLASYPLKNEDGTVPILEPSTYYVAKYMENESYYLFMGEVTPYAISKDLNTNSPFYVNGTYGEVRIVLSGGDYDNIYMSSLAQERADYELYLRCKIQDSVTLTCVPIYWLDVNWVIEITLPNKQGNETTEQYLIKSINTTLDINGTQTISLMKYYPLYPSL
ncbi:MAG: DUF5048 domain-containing protein [Nanoarchaeota archaeon]|nr:DUF5048 domain-containing protein [Nanoarchaeota archaeon]